MLFISRNDTHEEYSICLQIDWIVYSAAAKGVIDCYSLQELLFSQIKFCSTQTHKGLLLQKLQLQYRQKTSLLPGKVISAGSMVIIVLLSLPLLLFFCIFCLPQSQPQSVPGLPYQLSLPAASRPGGSRFSSHEHTKGA